MVANIIHNIENTDRYKLLCEQLDRQNIQAILWNAILGFDAKTGISKAHKQIVADAQMKGKKEVLIMEDDVYFPHEHGFKIFLDGIPKNKDFDIYLGGVYVVDGILNQIRK